MLCQSLMKSESLLQFEKRRGSVEVDTSSNSKSDSSDKALISQTHTQEMLHLDQSPAAGKGHDLSLIHNYATGETERQLGERLLELEREVRIYVSIYICE